MKIKKRITIVADILVDEGFDTNYLCICDMINMDEYHEEDIFVDGSDNFEVLDYISQEAIEIEENPLDTIMDNALGDESDEKS